jgi:hypothetical protein
LRQVGDLSPGLSFFLTVDPHHLLEIASDAGLEGTCAELPLSEFSSMTAAGDLP